MRHEAGQSIGEHRDGCGAVRPGVLDLDTAWTGNESAYVEEAQATFVLGIGGAGLADDRRLSRTTAEASGFGGRTMAAARSMPICAANPMPLPKWWWSRTRWMVRCSWSMISSASSVSQADGKVEKFA